MKNEHVHDEERFSSQIARLVIIFVFLLYIAWIGAWLLEQILEINFNYMATRQGQFIYWLLMKLIIWVLPSIIIIRYSGRKFVEVMSIKRFQSIMVWGCGFGLVLGAITIGTKALGHQPLFLFEDTLSFISGVIIAPIVEEVTFRGAVLGSLTQRYRFAVANTLTALFFLGIHMPGWYFQGNLTSNMSSPINGALTIFILGFVFGYVAHRSKSVSGSIITHILNNLFHA